MPHEFSQFGVIAATMLVAVVIGAFAVRLRQPLIVAFIAVGVLVGPSGLGWVNPGGNIELLATIGIAVLLFLVGLKLDVEVVRSMGPVALSTGLGQVAFTSIVGFLICLALGLGAVASIYVAVALTFSSTIIIVKLLSDKREIDSLHGRIAVGFLIVQDLVVILAMIGLSSMGPAGEAVEGRPEFWKSAAFIIAKGIGLILVVGVLMRYVLPRLMRLVARSQELLILFATAWAVSLAAAGDVLGFSREVGAFLAGVSLASTPYREAIGGRLVSLRDFLLLFFFLSLGASLDLGLVGTQVGPAILLSLFVLIGNPLIVMAIMGAMGYRRRTGFLAGLTVAQISEFSLILCALGVSLGHIGPEIMGLVTLVGLITIGLSTYLILYSHQIYQRIGPWLGVFERQVPARESGHGQSARLDIDVVVFGMGRYGGQIARALSQRKLQVLGVDFDPSVVAECQREGMMALYADAEDPESPAALPLEGAKLVVSAIPHREVNLAIIQHLRAHGFAGKLVLAAHHHSDVAFLLRHGADVVLQPFSDAAERAADQLDRVLQTLPDGRTLNQKT